VSDAENIADAADPLWRVKVLWACIGALAGLIVGGLLAWRGLC